MRDYGKVHTSFWASATIRALDGDAKLLALYLLTSPHTNAAGAFRLPEAYACDDLGWTSERLRNCFETLSNAGFIVRDPATQWLWILKWHEWNRPENPNIRKAIIRLVAGIPSVVSFKKDLVALWSEKEISSETVSEPLRNPPSPSPSPSPSLEPGKGQSLPCQDGTEFVFSADVLDGYRAAYPRVDLQTEFAKMRAWLISNPERGKTRKGIAKFANTWLGKATPSAVATTTRKRKMLGEGSSTNYGDAA